MENNIKPFIKWVGGKGKIISTLEKYFPSFDGINRYMEPFVGGGALHFYLLKNYNIPIHMINDINWRLMVTYNTIIYNPHELISVLDELQKKWDGLDTEKQKEYYYQIRKEFNDLSDISDNFIKIAAYFIFLNKTGYNGLYRVNRRNEFNTPCGRYDHPLICDKETIIADSNAMKNTLVLNTSFLHLIQGKLDYDIKETFFYLDPPYIPISKTSSFTSYTMDSFNEEDQFNLKDFCDLINKKGGKFMLSNSHPENNFFETLYKEYNVHIIEAPRAVSAKSDSRKPVQEVLITNY